MIRWLAGLAVVLGLLAATVAWLNVRGEAPIDGSAAAPFQPTDEQVRRGAYLAQAGNCAACHTARGGAPYAGGTSIATPFGVVHASNLTPHPEHGIGRWTAAHFWRAMHHGRSADGRLLYPAFPYPNYTQVTREDSDALYAWLRTLPPVAQPNRPHGLRFPYDTQAALAVWRALFFRAEPFVPEPARSAEWNRGAYLVRGLGHCNACHASRNVFGATAGSLELGGGLIPMQNWYAPSLASPHEAGTAGWPTADVVALLKTGVAPQSSVMGPMAEVVYRSTQHLSDADVRAMAVFLQQLPPPAPPETPRAEPAPPSVLALGRQVYEQHCVACHGAQGQGVAGAYPRLAGNRAVRLAVPANLVRAVAHGGYLPSTAGNPRPYGMPPFRQSLSDDEIAAVLTFVRASWGNDSPPVSARDVLRYR